MPEVYGVALLCVVQHTETVKVVGVAIISHSPHSQHGSVFVTATGPGDCGSADATALERKQNSSKLKTVRSNIVRDAVTTTGAESRDTVRVKFTFPVNTGCILVEGSANPIDSRGKRRGM